MRIIDSTKSLCPVCLQWIDSAVVTKDDHKVYLEKKCPEHKGSLVFLSPDAEGFIVLRDFYFQTHQKIFPQTRYLCFLTPKCNLSCPICFLDSGMQDKEDINRKDLVRFLNNGKKEIIIFGAEPTCRKDIFEIISFLKKKQHSVSLYTNGIKLVDYKYAEKIKQTKVNKIYFQFDGFDDSIYEVLRKVKLKDLKIKALDNLKKINMPVVLDVALARDVNINQMGSIFEYALNNNFIKTINYIAYVRSGGGGKYLANQAIMPDELIDEISKATKMRINRVNMRIFQKLLYVYMSTLKKRTCFYIKYFWVFRTENNQYLTFDQIINFDMLEKILNKYVLLVKKQNQIIASMYLVLKLPFLLFSIKNNKAFFQMLKMIFSHVFNRGDYSCVRGEFLQLIFTTACDVDKADLKISQRCHVGMMYKNKQEKLEVFNENGMYLLNQEIQKKGV
ncbi:MAG: radical SAM protein [Candidatus Omnitrophota bacterium]